MRTHYNFEPVPFETHLQDVLKTNRGFHGWGHRFLYSEATLRYLLEALRFVNVRFYAYGESEDPDLRNLERHGGYSVHTEYSETGASSTPAAGSSYPSIVIVEASRGEVAPTVPRFLSEQLDREYFRYVR